jgi:acetyl-CoA acetyltransferase
MRSIQPSGGIQPFAGVRILDLTHDLGRYATRLFADLGAEVIRVEPPGALPDRSGDPHAFAFLNASKRSVVLDTATEAGRGGFARLAAGAAVIAHVAPFDLGGPCGPEDMDVFQVYDSFSAHVPLALEGYGYCAVGEAGKFLRESGIGPGGKLPTNTSGGHLSETYMQGWALQVECVRQLRDSCGARQVEGARRVHYSSDVAGKAVAVMYGR